MINKRTLKKYARYVDVISDRCLYRYTKTNLDLDRIFDAVESVFWLWVGQVVYNDNVNTFVTCQKSSTRFHFCEYDYPPTACALDR